VILAIGELGNTTIDDWNDPDELMDNLGVQITGAGVSSNKPGMNAMAAYINLITEGGPEYDRNPITSFIKDAFQHIPTGEWD